MDKEAWRWRCPAGPLAWGCALPMADLLGPLEPPARQPLHDRRRADRREARRGRTAWYRSRGGEGLAGLSPRPEALADEPGPARGLERRARHALRPQGFRALERVHGAHGPQRRRPPCGSWRARA